MSNNSKFSIIIPSYNEGDDIRLSIDSAIKQDYQNKEIIVVDDSSDNTPEIIKEYADKG
ncbi:MAG: glycosyltransferase family 2 protein, partial [Patescibacteria group bacterium]